MDLAQKLFDAVDSLIEEHGLKESFMSGIQSVGDGSEMLTFQFMTLAGRDVVMLINFHEVRGGKDGIVRITITEPGGATFQITQTSPEAALTAAEERLAEIFESIC